VDVRYARRPDQALPVWHDPAAVGWTPPFG
jgi:hypothetical protein